MQAILKKSGMFGLLVVLSMSLLACAGTETSQSTGEYIDDASITSKVKSNLLRDDDVSGLSVEVETYKGEVQLSGFVNSAEEKRRAEELAEEVSGVRNVKNDIRIK